MKIDAQLEESTNRKIFLRMVIAFSLITRQRELLQVFQRIRQGGQELTLDKKTSKEG